MVVRRAPRTSRGSATPLRRGRSRRGARRAVGYYFFLHELFGSLAGLVGVSCLLSVYVRLFVRLFANILCFDFEDTLEGSSHHGILGHWRCFAAYMFHPCSDRVY